MARWTHTDEPDTTALELDEGHPLTGRTMRRSWRTWTDTATGRRVHVWRGEWDSARPSTSSEPSGDTPSLKRTDAS